MNGLTDYSWSSLWSDRKKIAKEFNGDETICGEDFAWNYILSQVLIIAVPFIIIGITAVSKMIVGAISSFEKA